MPGTSLDTVSRVEEKKLRPHLQGIYIPVGKEMDNKHITNK